MVVPGFVDHVVFRVAELDRTERFYEALLGKPAQRSQEHVVFLVGETRVFFTVAAEPAAGLYAKERVGLNHLAFGVRSLTELRAMALQMDAAGVAHSGVRLDRYGSTEYIWLDDPDGMRVEFYLRSEPAETRPS